MIKVTIQDLHRNSPRCVNNCPRYVVEGCTGGCTLRFRVSFACPHCGIVKCFYGGNNPLSCKNCKKGLPDMYSIKTDGAIGADIRVHYHLEENL